MKALLSTLTASLTVAMGATIASAQVLYNGLSEPYQTPAQQNWLYQGTTVSPVPTATSTKDGTVLNTGNSYNYAGYFNQTPITLDRLTGYTVSFKLKVDSEYHGNNNRAGFSVIVMSDQAAGEAQPFGIELGFWEKRIWAQSATFTKAETATYDTKSAAHTYHLKVSGNQYQLFVDNGSTPILQGPLRQYTGYTPPTGYPNPYMIPNLIFWGDNATSSKAQVKLIRVEVN